MYVIILEDSNTEGAQSIRSMKRLAIGQSNADPFRRVRNGFNGGVEKNLARPEKFVGLRLDQRLETPLINGEQILEDASASVKLCHGIGEPRLKSLLHHYQK